jgi:hypothetical protein
MVSLKGFFIARIPLILTVFSAFAQDLPPACNATVNVSTPLSPLSPCAQVSYLVSQNPASIPAQLAYECLISVPLHITEAKNLHRSLVPYLRWQTTLSYVKDPPVGYQMPAFDFWPTFDNVGVKLLSAAYSSEWEFGMDLFQTLNNVHDAHLRYIPDVVGKIFNFGRNVTLVSVSQDGHCLPQIYVHGMAPCLIKMFR